MPRLTCLTATALTSAALILIAPAASAETLQEALAQA